MEPKTEKIGVRAGKVGAEKTVVFLQPPVVQRGDAKNAEIICGSGPRQPSNYIRPSADDYRAACGSTAGATA